MNESLTLNDGTVYAGHCAESDGILWVYLDDTTMANAFQDWNDPLKTSRIVFDSYGEKATITGYAHLFCMREERSSVISAGLKQQ